MHINAIGAGLSGGRWGQQGSGFEPDHPEESNKTASQPVLKVTASQ